MSFSAMVFSGYMPSSELLDHIVDLFLVFFFFFLRNFVLFCVVAVSVYIPTNSIGGFPFLHTLCSVYCL